MATKLVGLKLTLTERKALDELVRNGYYATLSRALRAGLMLLLDSHKIKLATLADIRIERVRSPMRRGRKRKDEAADAH
jgi:Arc/MetJ-type ribon-helix-helix transcriptional regulator